MANFVSFENQHDLMVGIAKKFETVAGAHVFRGSVAFANLPATLTRAMGGYVYNVTDDFTTDARFIEGAGKKYKAGTNVEVADLSTDTYAAATPEGTENPHSLGWYERFGEAPDYIYALTADTTVDENKTYYIKTSNVNLKFDISGSFYNIDAILAMITGTFSEAENYETGNVVIYEDGLYQFTADHTAGAWNAAQVTTVTVVDLIAEAEPESLTTAQVNALLALLN